MKLFAYCGAVALLTVSAASRADVVTDWNDAALQAIRVHGTPPPPAARNLAIVHVALYDAVIGIERTHRRYLAVGHVSPTASTTIAAATAARDVLIALYPTDRAAFEQLHSQYVLRVPDGSSKRDALAWGTRVAAQILAARANDGSEAMVPWPGREEPGEWRPTISFGGAVRPALLPMWGHVTPFAVKSAQCRMSSPLPLHKRTYAAELKYVKEIGALDSPTRSVEQTQIAQFWGYGPGTATPPGHWNQIAQAVAIDQGNSMPENARLFALLNLALADAAIACWDCKYLFNYWRPITAIQLADADGNPWTSPDPAWMPLLPTPPFPEYPSGHSTFSGAAAAVLAAFYGKDRIPFHVGSDDMPGVVRFYDGFRHAAWESGMSRLYGGIHFMSSNLNGLRDGAAIGRYVVRHHLRPSKHSHGR